MAAAAELTEAEAAVYDRQLRVWGVDGGGGGAGATLLAATPAGKEEE